MGRCRGQPLGGGAPARLPSVARLMALAGTTGWLWTRLRSVSAYHVATSFWIDPDTPEDKTSYLTSYGRRMVLVASDEFNEDGRTFASGTDKMWTAIDAPDVTNNALEYNSPTHITTRDGNLEMKLTQQQMGGRSYVGASIQSWNKFCFTGGTVIVNNQWPSASGTWPGAWMMGNLGRPQYEESNKGVWPFSYNVCDSSMRTSQKISACNSNPGSGLHPNQGRGAPEIDILEAWATASSFFFPSSLQLAPSLPIYYKPGDGGLPTTPYGGPQPRSWYAVDYGTEINAWYGHDEKGYWSNAIASKKTLSATERFGFNDYIVEWEVGPQGFINFLFNSELLLSIPAAALKGRCDPSGNCVGDRLIPEEPMAFIFTMALAPSWAGGVGGLSALPAFFLVDYIRWYQDPAQVNIGCNPPDYPTAEYIAQHQELYGPPARPVPPATASFHYRYDKSKTPTTPNDRDKNSTSPSAPSEPVSVSPSPSSPRAPPAPTEESTHQTMPSQPSAQPTAGNERNKMTASGDAKPPSSLSAGAIAGIVVGALAAVVLGVWSVIMVRRYQEQVRHPYGRLSITETGEGGAAADAAEAGEPSGAPYIALP